MIGLSVDASDWKRTARNLTALGGRWQTTAQRSFREAGKLTRGRVIDEVLEKGGFRARNAGAGKIRRQNRLETTGHLEGHIRQTSYPGSIVPFVQGKKNPRAQYRSGIKVKQGEVFERKLYSPPYFSFIRELNGGNSHVLGREPGTNRTIGRPFYRVPAAVVMSEHVDENKHQEFFSRKFFNAAERFFRHEI